GYGARSEKFNTEAAMLQWVRGPITAVMHTRQSASAHDPVASMGPRSDNRGYVRPGMRGWAIRRASMGPRSDNRGDGETVQGTRWLGRGSMGPRSDNRGYDSA